MRFAWPLLLLLLLLIPAIAGARVWLRRRRPRGVRFSSLALLEPLRPTLRQRLSGAPLALRLACIGLLAVALARPQRGVSETRIHTEGVAIEMVVDRSGSMEEPMNAGGRQMSKIDVTKRVFKDFVLGDGETLPGRPNDVIGLITFARFAETLCPLSRTRDAIAALVDQITIAQLRMESGTAVGDGIALAAARLKNAEDEIRKRSKANTSDSFTIRSKVIILLTDGQTNAGTISPEDAAALAKEWGIKIYAIGIGDDARVVRMPGSGTVMRLPGGQGVDMGALEGIAAITGGRAWRAEDAAALQEACAAIDRLERTRIESVEFTDYEEAFPPLAMGALGSLLLETLLGATVLRRLP